MDFVNDALDDGRTFRMLMVVDQWSRLSPLPEVAARMAAKGWIGCSRALPDRANIGQN